MPNKALAEATFPYFLRKSADGDHRAAARLACDAAEEFEAEWAERHPAKSKSTVKAAKSKGEAAGSDKGEAEKS